MCEGIATELDGIWLGDERLNKRSVVVIEALAADRQASINGACDGWSDTLAAHHFFDIDAVTPEQILQPHREATLRRMREHPVVLIPQDTTELDYPRHPPRRTGCAWAWWGGESFDRMADSLARALERRTLPIKQQESFRWLKSSVEFEPSCPSRLGVVVTNRGYFDWSAQDFAPGDGEAWLRVRRDADDYIVDASGNDDHWNQLRVTHLDDGNGKPVSCGVDACSPKGSGFSCEFSNLSITATTAGVSQPDTGLN